jgi:organic radical activating enzyme
MKKVVKEKIEFYITNVCNLNCDNCNRLNNYYFSGHEYWSDYCDVYQQWSDLVDFEEITILGGEPTLNPSLLEWINGLRRLWPKAKINLLTNGSRLKYWFDRGLFNALSESNINLEVCLHNRDRHFDFLKEIQEYLINPVNTLDPDCLKYWPAAYNQVKDPTWPDCKSVEDFQNLPDQIKQECTDVHKIDPDNFANNTGIMRLVDEKNIHVSINYAVNFVTAPLTYAGNNQFTVYNSDPIKAHDVCISKHCTEMIRGKMYKCHHVALLPEFAKQYDVVMTEDQKRLLEQYQPLTANTSADKLEKSFKDLRNVIPQCSLCPSKLESILLKSSTNKIKIKKKMVE